MHLILRILQPSQALFRTFLADILIDSVASGGGIGLHNRDADVKARHCGEAVHKLVESRKTTR